MKPAGLMTGSVPRPGRARLGGFTLLEVVLAVALSVGLVAAVLAFYERSLNARKVLLAQAQEASERRAVMDRLTEELRAALVYPTFEGTQMGMEGAIDGMEFPSATLPGAVAWVVADDLNSPPPGQMDVQIVGYRLSYVEDGDGAVVIAGLQRSCRRIMVWSRGEGEEGPETEVRLVGPGVKFFRVRYWSDSGWLESWGGGDLPKAVEISLGSEPLPDGVEPVDYPYEAARRVIYVPVGDRPAQAGASP